MSDETKRSIITAAAVFMIVVVVVGALYLFIGPTRRSSQSTPPEQVVLMTIHGQDETGALIDPVNVWKDYQNRSAGVVGRAHHGDKVRLIRQSGGAALIRLTDGTEGWVNVAFIKELR